MSEQQLREKLKSLVMQLQTPPPPVIQYGPLIYPPAGQSEAKLRSALTEYFSAQTQPAAIVSPFDISFTALSNDNAVETFSYGSGDENDIINKNPDEIETGLSVKTCTPLKGYVLLVFSVGTLFEKCSRYTLMKSKIVDHQAQNQGAHLAGLLGLTEDEWEFFGEDFLQNAANAIHNILGAYGRSLGIRSMVFDPGTVDEPGTIVYAVKIPDKGFFHNYVLQLYENVASALYYSVLQQWAQWCNDAGEVQANTLKYEGFHTGILSFRNIGCPRTRRPIKFY